jgi:methyl coenzyme M reductase gamma subunit
VSITDEQIVRLWAHSWAPYINDEVRPAIERILADNERLRERLAVTEATLAGMRKRYEGK